MPTSGRRTRSSGSLPAPERFSGASTSVGSSTSTPCKAMAPFSTASLTTQSATVSLSRENSGPSFSKSKSSRSNKTLSFRSQSVVIPTGGRNLLVLCHSDPVVLSFRSRRVVIPPLHLLSFRPQGGICSCFVIPIPIRCHSDRREEPALLCLVIPTAGRNLLPLSEEPQSNDRKLLDRSAALPWLVVIDDFE